MMETNYIFGRRMLAVAVVLVALLSDAHDGGLLSPGRPLAYFLTGLYQYRYNRSEISLILRHFFQEPSILCPAT